MGQEIERKFLLKEMPSAANLEEGFVIQQGYLNTDKERTVRVRIKGLSGYLTIKGENKGSVRAEFEYEIPVNDAMNLLKLCHKPLIEKKRFNVLENDLLWEVDIFEGENKGLAVVEVELEDENQEIIIPKWVGKEVTDDARYYNSNLIKNPFSTWD